MNGVPIQQACLNVPCMHAPAEAELARDPAYRGCFAPAGEPCVWARRYDGETNPLFHSERLEAAMPTEPHSGQVNDDAFEQAVLNCGLV